MGKLGKALKALYWVARKPVLLNRVLADDDSWKELAGRRFGRGEGLPLITLAQLLGDPAQGVAASVGPMTFLDGGSLPTDMLLLAKLAESIDGCSYFEIGTWRGESVATVASRAKSCHTLSLTDEEMRALGMAEKAIRQHRMFSGPLENVIHLEGDSKTFDYPGLGQQFDLVFIDGDHHYDAVVSDTRNVFRHLVHERTIVVWHDYGFHPDRVRFEVLAAILEAAGPERREMIYQVAHTKCAVFTGREYEPVGTGPATEPLEYYHLDISGQSRRTSDNSADQRSMNDPDI